MREKCSFAIDSDILAALRLFSVASGKDMSAILDRALLREIPAALLEQAKTLRATYAEDGEEEAPAKPTRKPQEPRKAPKAATGGDGKPEGFDEAFWALCDSQGISAPAVAATLERREIKVTSAGVRYWRKAQQGIPGDVVPFLLEEFPQLQQGGEAVAD